jgi:hypothetical protein
LSDDIVDEGASEIGKFSICSVEVAGLIVLAHYSVGKSPHVAGPGSNLVSIELERYFGGILTWRSLSWPRGGQKSRLDSKR